MPAISKLQRKTDDPSRIPIFWEGLKSIIKKNLGLTKITLKDPDSDKLQAAITKLKKPAEFWFTVDGDKFTVDVRVGTNKADKTVLGTFDLSSEQDATVRRETFQTLYNGYELVAKADWDKFQKAHPDPEEVEKVKKEIYDTGWDLKNAVADRKAFNSWTKYDLEARSGGYNLQDQLRDWLKDKHQSWAHYVTFINDVDSAVDPKKIFDTYMKQGATLPVNLPPKYQEPVEHAIANGAAPDFKPARAAIVQIVNAKFIPLFRKERLALDDKDIKEATAKLNAANKKLADMGGK